MNDIGQTLYNRSESDENVELPPDSDSDLDEASVSIGLNKAGEEGSGYHTRNNPTDRLQRAVATDRRGIIQVRLKSCEIIHGQLSPDGENATLLIYDFRLDTTKRLRRVRHATLEFQFSSSVPGVRAPVVQAIAPDGRHTLLDSTQEETITRGTELNAGASQFVEVGGMVKWEKTVSRTTSDAATVKGHIFCDEFGNEVGVRWDILENASLKSGTPSFLRCAILLDRKFNQENFECTIKVKAEADWKSEIGRLFGSTPVDDPILFDPTLPPTNKLRKDGYDMDNLGDLRLEDFVQIIFERSRDKQATDSFAG